MHILFGVLFFALGPVLTEGKAYLKKTIIRVVYMYDNGVANLHSRLSVKQPNGKFLKNGQLHIVQCTPEDWLEGATRHFLSRNARSKNRSLAKDIASTTVLNINFSNNELLVIFTILWQTCLWQSNFLLLSKEKENCLC